MPIAQRLKRWWDFCMSEDKKKEKEPIVTGYAFNVYDLRVFEYFDAENYI